ncbi:MAG: VWA domain-containing protein [Gammaproteobacteria bacterium]|nr:VWA domain-containing protein [Gammaproteobacteria bacterium]
MAVHSAGTDVGETLGNSTPSLGEDGMARSVALFVRALRNAGLAVSPAETLDAIAILSHIGMSDPNKFRDALALSLAKTCQEKESFYATFERFFGSFAFRQAPKRTLVSRSDAAELIGSMRSGVSAQLLNELIDPVLSGKRDLLSLKVQRAANENRVHQIASLREKREYIERLSDYLGLNELTNFIRGGTARSEVRHLHTYLRDELAEYMDVQYKNHVDATGKKVILDAALKSQLRHIPFEYHEAIRNVIRKLADRLVRSHRKKQSNAARGQLDIKRTLRRNLAYEGSLFDLKWRKSKRKVATVFVLCDVSGSVSQIARFLLLFLYELVDVLPRIRAFAFSSDIGEVTQVFSKQPSEMAIEETLFQWGKGNTDYGRVLRGFRRMCSNELGPRSTLIVFGDARSNFYDPGLSTFRELANRVKQVYWLNPEERQQWSDGDSEMGKFAPYCTRVDLCRKLSDIERFADRLLTNSR